MIIPGNVTLQPGDRLAFICCGKGHLRALENQTRRTGWRLPSRAIGERSRMLAATGLAALSVAAPAFVVLALGFALVGSLLFMTTVAEVLATGSGGGDNSSEIESGRAAIVEVLLLVGALILILVGVIAWSGRPRINRDFVSND